MNPGRFVGRVGGLAVALGVGVSVGSSPGVAWADGTGSAGSDGSTGSAGATGTHGSSESQGSTTVGTTAEPAGKPTAAGTEAKGASTPRSGSVNTSESGASASTGASVRQVPPGMAMSTGGASASTESNSETLANSDGAAELTTDRALPKPVADSTATDPEAPPAAMTTPTGDPKRGSKRHQPQLDDPTGAPGVGATTRTATRTAVLSRRDVSPPPPVLVDIALREPAEQQPLTALNAAAQQPLTAVNAMPHLPPQVNFIAHAISAERTEPTEPPNTVRTVVLAALATVGLGPLAANGPVLPADSPVGWALLAVGARRFGQPAIQETRNL